MDWSDRFKTKIPDYLDNCPLNVICTEVGCAGTDNSWSAAWNSFYNITDNYIQGGSDVLLKNYLGSILWVCDQNAANNNVAALPDRPDTPNPPFPNQNLNNINQEQMTQVYTQFP